MRHIGNGDPDDMAARVGRVIIGVRPAGVVVVPGVGGVYRYERQFAEVGSVPQIDGLCAFRLRDGVFREVVWNAVLVDRDHGHRLWR